MRDVLLFIGVISACACIVGWSWHFIQEAHLKRKNLPYELEGLHYEISDAHLAINQLLRLTKQ